MHSHTSFGQKMGQMSGENGDLGLYLYSTCTFIAQKLPNAPTEIHVKIVYLYSISTHTAKKWWFKAKNSHNNTI